MAPFLAMNCQDFGELSRVATIMQPLRDKTPRIAHTPNRPFAGAPIRPFADTAPPDSLELLVTP